MTHDYKAALGYLNEYVQRSPVTFSSSALEPIRAALLIADAVMKEPSDTALACFWKAGSQLTVLDKYNMWRKVMLKEIGVKS